MQPNSCRKWLATTLCATLSFGLLAETAHSSTWNPTLLVNTEAFQIIHEGDSAAGTDIELRFGDTVAEKLYWDRANAEFRFSDDLRVDGNITASGTLTVSGNAKTKGDLTINSDNGAANAVLTFGNATTAQTLTFIDSAQKFSFSKDMRVLGNLSGSSLNVDGNAGIYGGLTVSGATILKSTLRLNGVTYTFPTSDGSATGKVLKTSGAGVLSWSADSGGTAGQGITVAGSVISLSSAFSGTSLNLTTYLGNSGTLVNAGAGKFKGDLAINSDSGAADAILTFGSDTTNETLKFLNNEDRFEFSDDVHATGNITSSGTLKADTALVTEGNITINQDADSNDAILTFGSDTTNETLTWQNTPDKFRFSDDVAVAGNLSGSTLNVDGAAGIYGTLTVSGATTLKSTLKINSVTYTFPTSVGAASGQVLKTNTTGTLSWASLRGSGGISLHPEYPNALYFGSGSNNVGTLALRVSSGSEIGNTYRWATTRTTNQNYWLQVRARLPDDFTGWEATPIQLRYRTMSGYIAGYMRDTADAAVALTGVSNIQNAAWTTAAITGPNTTGTWTGGGYFTFLLRLTNSGAIAGKEGRSFTDIGFLNFNVDTKLP